LNLFISLAFGVLVYLAVLTLLGYIKKEDVGFFRSVLRLNS
jgi:hypothetical protein